MVSCKNIRPKWETTLFFTSALLSPKGMSDTGNLDNVGTIEQE